MRDETSIACRELLRDFCRTIGAHEASLDAESSVTVDEAEFHFLPSASADPQGITIALDLGPLPADREPVLLEWLRENTSALCLGRAFAVLPHNGHGAALRHIALNEGVWDGDRLASMLIEWAAEFHASRGGVVYAFGEAT